MELIGSDTLSIAEHKGVQYGMIWKLKTFVYKFQDFEIVTDYDNNILEHTATPLLIEKLLKQWI